MKNRLLLPALALVLGLTASAQTGPSPAGTPVPPPIDATLFDYDHTAPFAVREVGAETRDGALVRDLTFVGVKEPVKAYLVAPAESTGPRAAVLFVHWLGEPATTNRTQFLPEAIALARRGVVSLLVDGMWANPQWWDGRQLETDLAGGVNQVIELRRAMDLLLSQPDIDPARFAVVGHDFGAMYGSIAAALDGRAKTVVFAAPTPRMANWYLLGRKLEPAAADAYRAQLRPIDPVEWVAKLGPKSVLFQFAAKDRYVPARHAAEYYGTALPRKVMATYDTDHAMNLAAVVEDRTAWLVKELDLR
jgi:dienelactone hydrolase